MARRTFSTGPSAARGDGGTKTERTRAKAVEEFRPVDDEGVSTDGQFEFTASNCRPILAAPAPNHNPTPISSAAAIARAGALRWLGWGRRAAFAMLKISVNDGVSRCRAIGISARSSRRSKAVRIANLGSTAGMLLVSHARFRWGAMGARWQKNSMGTNCP